MKKIIITIVVVLTVITLFIGYMYHFQKKELGLICDAIGITKNTFEFDIDKKIKNYTIIYWYGETSHPAKKNRIVIFNRFLQSDIPSSQGKNWLKIQIGELIYDRIGIYKPESWSKHNYHVSVKLVNEKLIINWCISNWYDTKIEQGKDTIIIANNRRKYKDL